MSNCRSAESNHGRKICAKLTSLLKNSPLQVLLDNQLVRTLTFPTSLNKIQGLQHALFCCTQWLDFPRERDTSFEDIVLVENASDEEEEVR